MESAVPQTGKVIAVYSGGLDSTVMLYHLRHGKHEIKALSVDYGQRHSRELDAAIEICRKLKVEHQVVDLSSLQPLLAGSALTSDDIEVPDGRYEDESMAITVVPNRNMILMSIAAGWAISSGFEAIAYGAHSGDHAIYPDCRLDFIHAMKQALGLCHVTPVSVWSPFANLTKAQIVQYGHSLKVPFKKTWSCYQGREKHCGRCGTCQERREAFKEAKVQDPTEYER